MGGRRGVCRPAGACRRFGPDERYTRSQGTVGDIRPGPPQLRPGRALAHTGAVRLRISTDRTVARPTPPGRATTRSGRPPRNHPPVPGRPTSFSAPLGTDQGARHRPGSFRLLTRWTHVHRSAPAVRPRSRAPAAAAPGAVARPAPAGLRAAHLAGPGRRAAAAGRRAGQPLAGAAGPGGGAAVRPGQRAGRPPRAAGRRRVRGPARLDGRRRALVAGAPRGPGVPGAGAPRGGPREELDRPARTPRQPPGTGYFPSGHTATALLAYGGAVLVLLPWLRGDRARRGPSPWARCSSSACRTGSSGGASTGRWTSWRAGASERCCSARWARS